MLRPQARVSVSRAVGVPRPHDTVMDTFRGFVPPCLLVCCITLQHTLNQRRLQQRTTPTVCACR